MIRKYKFPVINISQFYSRTGTVAAKWKKVDSKEVKRRSTETAKLFKSYPNYNHLKNTIQRVWIHDTKDEGRGPDENVMVGHTKSYVKVLIKRERELVGKRAIVKITDIHKWHVYGEIIERDPKPVHVNFHHHFKGMYNQKKEVANNILNDIKKEQEDIHATIKFDLTAEQDREDVIHLEASFAEQDYAASNKATVKTTNNFDISNFAFFISLIFLFVGIYNLKL